MDGSGWSSMWGHDSGIGSLDLLGWKDSKGKISQTFDVVQGKTYKVGFAMSGNNWAGPTLKLIDVSVDGSNMPTLTYKFDTSKQSGWEKHSFEFTALGNTATLSFKGYVEGNVVSDFGPRLDSVTVKAIDGSSTNPNECCCK